MSFLTMKKETIDSRDKILNVLLELTKLSGEQLAECLFKDMILEKCFTYTSCIPFGYACYEYDDFFSKNNATKWYEYALDKRKRTILKLNKIVVAIVEHFLYYRNLPIENKTFYLVNYKGVRFIIGHYDNVYSVGICCCVSGGCEIDYNYSTVNNSLINKSAKYHPSNERYIFKIDEYFKNE